MYYLFSLVSLIFLKFKIFSRSKVSNLKNKILFAYNENFDLEKWLYRCFRKKKFKIFKDISSGKIPFFIIENKKKLSKPVKTLFYISGGAYIFKMSVIHLLFLKKVCLKKNYRIIFPIIPSALNTSLKNINLQIQQILEFSLQKYQFSNFILGGDSSGGGSALTVFLNIKKKYQNLEKMLLLSPFVDPNFSNYDLKKYVKIDPIFSLDDIKFWHKNLHKSNFKNNKFIDDFNVTYRHDLEKLKNLKKIILWYGKKEILKPQIDEFCQKLRKNKIHFQLIYDPKGVHVEPIFSGKIHSILEEI